MDEEIIFKQMNRACRNLIFNSIFFQKKQCSLALTFLLIFGSGFGARAGNGCDDWFKNSKLKPGKNCLLECASLPVDMGTFPCPRECSNFCNTSVQEDFFFKISEIYPGLTNEERALVAKEPSKSAVAFQLSLKAENLCTTVYPSSRTNDESDACRHFVWAALLYREFGTEFSNRLLNAHEQDPKQPNEEKAMDLANNRQGLITAEELSKNHQLSDSKILEAFHKNLSKGRLIVLKRRTVTGGVR